MAEKIDQDVREAAADMQRWRSHDKPTPAEDAIRDGELDDNYTVQAFARMKAAGREQGLREAAAIFTEAAEATRQDANDGLWGGIEDEVGDAISTFNGHAARILALLSEKPA